MPNEDLSYIEDDNGQKLFYRFTPASMASNFVPLVVILGNEESAQAKKFEYKMWNILRPIEDFGPENRGSHWLGEKGDLFRKDLLQTLIYQIAEEHDCEDHIYLYGSGRGAYGAVVHGILCKANAVYAHSPGISLPGVIDIDLSSFSKAEDSFPVFYLCDDTGSVENRDDQSHEDDRDDFAEVCKKYNIKFHLDLCPEPEAGEEYALKKVLDMFERVRPEV